MYFLDPETPCPRQAGVQGNISTFFYQNMAKFSIQILISHTGLYIYKKTENKDKNPAIPI